jgi:iron complex transport system permease protein
VANVIWQVRGPRVLAAALVGAALAVAGTAFQGCSAIRWCRRSFSARRRARRSAPCSASTSRSACSRSRPSPSSAAGRGRRRLLIGSAVRARDPILVLVLTGVVIGSLLGAGVGLVKYLADPTTSFRR